MGDENCKHALAEFLVKTNFEIPTLVFFMTDAGYHPNREGDSYPNYIKHEKEEIEKMGFEFDIFKIWEKIPKDKLFFFPTTFSGCLRHPHTQDFGQMAEQGNGIYMFVKQRTADVISTAMLCILTNILDRLCGETEEILTSIPGFELFDTSSIIPITHEKGERKGEMVSLFGKDMELSKYLGTKMEKLITLVGAGWSKRKITLDPACLMQQMKLIAFSIKYLTGDDSVKPQIETCLTKIQEYIPEDQARFLSISLAKIEELREQVRIFNFLVQWFLIFLKVVFSELTDDTKDLVTLMTVQEEIAELDLIEIEKDFIAAVCSTLYGVPVRIR